MDFVSGFVCCCGFGCCCGLICGFTGLWFVSGFEEENWENCCGLISGFDGFCLMVCFCL